MIGALVLGSVFVASVVTQLHRSEVEKVAQRNQSQSVREVTRSLASRVAPLLEADDDLRISMMAGSAAEIGGYRVLVLDREGVVRLDTGLVLGGKTLELRSSDGPVERELEDGRAEFAAPALGRAGQLGEVRLRYQVTPATAAGSLGVIYGGCLLACITLVLLGGLLVNHWMGQVREATRVANDIASGDHSARCQGSASGAIRDLQDSIHDLGAVADEGAQHVEKSFMELAYQTVEVLERRGASGHGERVCEYSMLLADRLGLTEEERRDIAVAARLHDLGDVFEPPERGDDAQAVQRMRLAPRRAAELLDGISHMRHAAEAVLHHREHFDGTGFPDGQRGERIPLGARIVGIADAFDQLTTVCATNGAALSWPRALDELAADRGGAFDPWLVDLFDEEIRKSPPTETATVMISTRGAVPYKITQRDEAAELLEATEFSWGDEWSSDLELLGDSADELILEEIPEEVLGEAGDGIGDAE